MASSSVRSSSSVGRMCALRWMMVTREPNRENICASSRATYRPPRTRSSAGTSVSSMTVVLVRKPESARPGMFGMVGFAPVAITKRPARIVLSATRSVSLPVKAACPLKSVTFGKPRRLSIYFVWRISSTSLSFWATSLEKSVSSPRTAMPAKGVCCAQWSDSAARISAFDGTHPTLIQVPPTVPRSRKATVAPRSDALMAAANAAPPEPITTRSKSPSPRVMAVTAPWSDP